MSAIISSDEKYRYELRRRFGLGSMTCCLIMLNPSTADAETDDATIRRCIGFAKAWGYDEMIVVNLFAFRATKPIDLFKAADPVGPENMAHLSSAALSARAVVCAWGVHGCFKSQGFNVLRRLNDLGVNPLALARTKNGHPAHPLYLSKKLVPQPIAILATAPA